jgi:hypothetical protein
MKKGLTDILMILDESSSMSIVRDPTINGFNEFLNTQKQVPGEARVTLIKFNSTWKTIIDNTDIKMVSPLTRESYNPSGMTNLIDTIITAIDNKGNYLARLSESERPEKVLVCIQTDGEQTCVSENTIETVRERIKHQTEKYNWQFAFLGANIDAVSVAGSYGINAVSAMSYHHSDIGTSKGFSSLSRSASMYRMADSDAQFAFTNQDKQEQENLINNH